jgi:hypothetical protein|tara:strand:+ start:1386 stop:1652 length:267 start_codon:yes stop_codon:yes gene_type:complete
MKASKRKLRLRERVRTLEEVINNMRMGTIESLVRTVSVLASTFEEYISMKGDTEKFVKHLEKSIDENKSAAEREKKQAKRSGAPKAGS